MNSRLLIPTWFLASCAFGCLTAAIADDGLTDKQVAWFETNIRPLLAEKCYSCHSARDDNAEGGLTLDTRAGWQKGGDHGPAITPGELDSSLLIRAIRYEDPDLEMPPDKKLSDRQIKLLEQWVAAGAPDPRTETVSRSDVVDPSDPIAGRSHWAYQPLNPTVLPNLPNELADWARSPIDALVAGKLLENQLAPSPAADRATLGKRLYLLLTGLPPTEGELKAFVGNPAPDAYEQLVDELLASPRFGETWGRHWLDLARYADSNGLDENFLFREAWRYRNWVIDAINLDMPFDRFTRVQLAGDLLPFDDIDQRDRQRIGSGFLVIGPKVLLGVNNQLQEMDVADELISTVGTTFLGQTLGCARCHDHKFDPIPTADYYAMAGVFTSTEVMQTRYMLGEQRKMERLYGLGPRENETNAAYEKYWRERGQLKNRLDQAKQVVELLKKEDTAFRQLLDGHGDALQADLKKKLKTLVDAGVENFAMLRQRKESMTASSRPQPPGPDDESAAPPEKPLPVELDQQAALQSQQAWAAELEKSYTQPPPIPPRAMIATDKPQPANEAIRIAGQFDRKGATVPRGFLQVVSEQTVEIDEKSSGRLELANWLTDVDQGAGRLTARVLANRIWHHLIGRGIVRTTDNFGRTGEAPTHPELLDHLAGELIDSGWSLKKLVRGIVLSQTFRQSSRHREAADRIDPENRLLWRAHRRRLTPEAYRDAMLMAAGILDNRPLHSTVNYLGDQATAVGANTNRRKTDYPNRSIYLPVIRNDLPEIFEAFDFANAHRPTGNRPVTTVATTGLYILNDPLMLSSSRSLARQLLAQPGISDEQRVRSMFARILQEECDAYEVQQIIETVSTVEAMTYQELERQHEAQPADKKSEADAELRGRWRAEAQLRAWSVASHAVFASSRFQILE